MPGSTGLLLESNTIGIVVVATWAATPKARPQSLRSLRPRGKPDRPPAPAADCSHPPPSDIRSVRFGPRHSRSHSGLAKGCYQVRVCDARPAVHEAHDWQTPAARASPAARRLPRRAAELAPFHLNEPHSVSHEPGPAVEISQSRSQFSQCRFATLRAPRPLGNRNRRSLRIGWCARSPRSGSARPKERPRCIIK